MRQNADAIAASIVLEQGKTLAGIHLPLFSLPRLHTVFTDAHGDLLRGLQVVETAASATTTLLGDKIEGVFRIPRSSYLLLTPQ